MGPQPNPNQAMPRYRCSIAALPQTAAGPPTAAWRRHLGPAEGWRMTFVRGTCGMRGCGTPRSRSRSLALTLGVPGSEGRWVRGGLGLEMMRGPQKGLVWRGPGWVSLRLGRLASRPRGAGGALWSAPTGKGRMHCAVQARLGRAFG